MLILFKFLLFFSLMTQDVIALDQMLLAKMDLDQATKEVTQNDKNKVLGAKTERIDGRNVHVIKVLTPDGRVQYIRVDEESGQLIK